MSRATAPTARSLSESMIPTSWCARDASIARRRRNLLKANGTKSPALSRNDNLCEQKKFPRYVFRIVGIKQEKEGGKRQKPKGASKTIKPQSNFYAKPSTDKNKFDNDIPGC